jgi:hypothetical protein
MFAPFLSGLQYRVSGVSRPPIWLSLSPLRSTRPFALHVQETSLHSRRISLGLSRGRRTMSLFSLSRWRPQHLFLSWVGYWVALLAVTLGPAVPAILRATGSAPGKGEISFNFADGIFSLVVKQAGQVLWTGSVHFLAAALWIAVPPMVLWLLWLRARSGAAPREASTVRT